MLQFQASTPARASGADGDDGGGGGGGGEDDGERHLTLLAHDPNSQWTIAVQAVDDEHVLAAEVGGNLFVTQARLGEASEEERSRLHEVAHYHLGENVRCLKRGSLVMELPPSERLDLQPVLWTANSGAIGVLAALPPPLFTIMWQLQEALNKVVHGVGGLSHAHHRAFHTEGLHVPQSGFVDGDLVELFLELSREQQEAVIQAVGTDLTVEQAIHHVDLLKRSLH